MKQPHNCKVKDCEIRNVLKKLWPYYRVKLLHAIWNRKVDTTEKKMQLESFSFDKTFKCRRIGVRSSRCTKSTFYGTMGLIQS